MAIGQLRDYHDELKTIVDVKDPMIRLEATTMWVDNLPEAKKQNDPNLLNQADGKIDSLVKSQQKLAFETDCLSLARDASQLASLYKEEQASERSNRLAKVMHLKQENSLGSNIVTQHMMQYAQFVSGPKNDLFPELEKVWLMRNQNISYLFYTGIWRIFHENNI